MRGDDAGKRYGPQRRHAAEDSEREQKIGAETDIGLLANRDETGVAGKQIPQARQRDVGVHLRQQLQIAAAAPEWRGGKRDERRPR